MNWQLWFEGLAIAAVTGATNGAVQALQNGGKITGATGISAGIGALLGVLAYLKQPAIAQATQDSPAPVGGPLVQGTVPPAPLVPSGPRPPK